MREQRSSTRQEQRSNRFGNYDLIRRIDVGGMGEVYLAHQRTAFDREVAIKIIRSDLVYDMMARKRFLREAEVNSHIKHEHILPLFEFGEEQGRLFLVTPYIAGGTLAQRLQNGPLSLAETYQLFTALVEAVAYIHRRGVVHRDLKPGNILLDQGDSDEVYVRLIDFGIATISGQEASPPLTTAGNEMGTAAYMAPERLSGIAAPSNDIYSLGIILYQMLTGRLPARDEPVGMVPKLLEYVIQYSTASNPEHRFKTADDLLKAFEDACLYLETSTNEDVSETFIIRNRAARSSKKSTPELQAVHHSDTVPPPAPAHTLRPDGFTQADYAAPTTNVGGPGMPGKYEQTASPSPIPDRTKRARRNPLLAIITISMVVILLIMAGLFTFEFQPFGFIMPNIVTANINISPQVRVVKQVYHITARPGQKSIAAATTSIPANVFSSSKTASQTGPTSGLHCDLGIFNCQQSVDASDIVPLAAQLKQNLELQITQDLQNKVQKASAKVVGNAHFADVSVSNNPGVGAISKTVTVTLTEQGSIEYMLPSDAQTLARQLIPQQVHSLGANYILLNSSIQVGQPVVTGVDNNGIISLDIPAGALAQYKFSQSQLQSMQNRLKGLKLQAAIAMIKKQPGVDPQSISITLSSGTTLPTDITNIKMFPHNPDSLPPIDLPTIATPPTSNNTNSTPPAGSPTADATNEGA